jgi:16S rRNA (uracil1498-N3)-methyltransferase
MEGAIQEDGTAQRILRHLGRYLITHPLLSAQEIARMAERFYVNSELAPGLVVIRGPEAHHLGTVCRIRPGDTVCLFNGDGSEYPARVGDVSRRDVTVEVLARDCPQRELPLSLHVAAPLPRGDRAQFLVEKLTELGATSLTILLTERSVVSPRETKREKLERYVIEASKQCGRNVLMRIEPPQEWRAFLGDEQLPEERLLAHPGGRLLRTRALGSGDVVAAVGPEGGFSDDEVAVALAMGWQAIDLGPRILRVETAALGLAAYFALV